MGPFVADRYELVTHVAEGPIADVWHATQHGAAGFARPVAVRVLRPTYARDTHFVGSWAASASVLAASTSRHLESVFDLVVEGEELYVVSEWIEGVSLGQWFAGPLPWPIAARIAQGVLEGLEEGHVRGLCHLGVTPSAVRVDFEGGVRLMRFGVGAALFDTGRGGEEAQAHGLMHPAPELRDGRTPTPATDLFGVGVLLHTLLTGLAPWPNPWMAGPAPDVGAARPDAPPLLVALVERAMREDPPDRLSADELRTALARLVEAEPPSESDLHRAVWGATEHAEAEAEVETEQASAGASALAASIAAMAVAPVESAPLPAAAPSASRAAALASLAAMAAAEPTPSRDPVPDLISVPDPVPASDPVSAVESEPSVSEEPLAEEPVADEPPPTKPRRYNFKSKGRIATARARGAVEPEYSEAAPLPLTTSKPFVPSGLAPARTEFLDEDQIDQLTIKKPRGLSPARTECLDPDQVDRLTIKKPRGLQPARTEFLDPDQVDRLTLDDD